MPASLVPIMRPFDKDVSLAYEGAAAGFFMAGRTRSCGDMVTISIRTERQTRLSMWKACTSDLGSNCCGGTCPSRCALYKKDRHRHDGEHRYPPLTILNFRCASANILLKSSPLTPVFNVARFFDVQPSSHQSTLMHGGKGGYNETV